MGQKTERLDDFNKIMIATNAICYMAHAIHETNNQMKWIPDENGYHKEGIEEKDRLLNLTIKKLAQIMEDLGENMNGTDCICPIDVAVTAAAFKIIVHGKDNVEENPLETK